VNVCFRANGGGAGIGLGHLSRCIAIADAFRELGADCFFVSKAYKAGISFIKESGYVVYPLSPSLVGEDDLKASLEYMREADVIIADSYEFDTKYLAGLSKTGTIVAAMDDKIDLDLPVDYVIGNIYSTIDSYGDRLSKRAVLLAGPENYPLRKRFQYLPSHRIHDHVNEILVTMGGEDPMNVTESVVEAVSEYREEIILHILIGAAYAHGEELFNKLRTMRQRFVIHKNIKNPEDLVALFQKIDLAITAMGITFLELAATGVPMVLVQTADNQIHVSEFAGKKGLGIVLSNKKESIKSELIKALRLLEDKQTRAEYSRNCQGLIDGRGASRMAETIFNEFTNRRKKYADGL